MYQIKTDASALPWSPMGWPGVSMKMFEPVESGGGTTGMLRMEAGSSIAAHSNANVDQMVFVIEGDHIDDGVSYGPGSFLVAKLGPRTARTARWADASC